ncbi:molybdate ABC transporter permease subunit [Parvibium lacunae]|uniref:Molybdenum transport system permease n=1 Tax=Parvibium lacunae TaxID=1888893 RepID=A0A368L463_9BURK|nr:molybdate ABC transporter permease subunit [Parvibium lacunae]RCS58357.1 molybdate ABC transporter permease subunit [Parvibium lacunae]
MITQLAPAFLLSLKVASWACLIALVIGVLLGYTLAHWRWRGQALLDSLLLLPMVLPPTVLGYYLLVVLGRQGWLGQWLESWFGVRLIFTWQGAVIAASVIALPLVYKSARAAFESVDTQLEQTAQSLGLSACAVFFRVSLPLASRGILAGGLLAFTRAFGEFGATLMIAGSIPGQTQTLSIAVYEAVQAGQDTLAAWLVALMSLTCISLLLLAQRLMPRALRQI